MLIIDFFGKPKVVFNGEDITSALGSKACALLCILYLRGGEYSVRERLSAYLWPDSADEAAKYNLRYTLWKIKKHTDTDEAGNSLINFDREYCGINQDYNCICDVQSIDRLDVETLSLEYLERINALFRGELLEGYYFNKCDDFNELILSRRMYYEKKKNQLLTVTADLYEHAGDLQRAVDTMECIMDSEPYSERLALRLMILYEKHGERSRAITFFNEFRSNLVTNLQIYPGDEINEKYLEVKNAAAAENISLPSQAERASGVPAIHTFCIQGVPCFWMADAVGKILSGATDRQRKAMEPRVMRQLCAIQPAAAKYADSDCGEESPLIAAVAQAFLSFIHSVSAADPVILVIENPNYMDEVSKGTLSYLQNNMPSGLTITFAEKGTPQKQML